MYNIERMIKTGQDAIEQNPRRDIGGVEMRTLHDMANGDEYQLARDSFFVGVAVGMRIAAAQKKVNDN